VGTSEEEVIASVEEEIKLKVYIPNEKKQYPSVFKNSFSTTRTAAIESSKNNPSSYSSQGKK
jgi:hypothetical protein